ncbi:MAG TPA: PEGA domain-containing protein [Polyangiaceae bacterium]|nr:PEGA domain-containing protein [Polyangiaceae bacterium]
MRTSQTSIVRRHSSVLCALALASFAPTAFAQQTAAPAAPAATAPARPANAASGTATPTSAGPANAASGAATPTSAGPANAGAAAAGPANAGAAAGAANAGTAAGAADNAARGAELRRRGNRAADEGRFADALADYEEAAKLAPEPKNFYNLASAYQKVGRNADALAWFLRFKAGASRDELERAPNLDTRIAALRNKVAFLKVNVNVAGARVLVRDAVVGTKPADGPLEVSLNEGKATVEIIGEGYQPYRKEHTLLGGSALEIDVRLNREAPPTNVVERTKTVYVTSTPFWSQWWFWAGAGVLVVGGATTAYALSTEKSPTSGNLGQIVGPLGTRLSGLGLHF